MKQRIFAVLILLAIGFVAFRGFLYWKQHRFDAAITAAARRYGLDTALIRAVIWQESRFNPGVRGRAGELGLMQIREAAAMEWAAAEHIKSFKHADCLDPDTNILAGSYYLRSVLRHYARADNPIPYALAEYNAGRGNVLKWLGGGASTNSAAFMQQIGFPGTKAYVAAILDRRDYYQR